MSVSLRALAIVSLHVAAARIRVRASTLQMWSEVGVGPARDEHGVYRRDVVTAWVAEMQFAQRHDVHQAGTAS